MSGEQTTLLISRSGRVTVASFNAGHLEHSVGATLDAVETWLAATKARLPRKSVARFEALAKDWRAGRTKGFKAFELRNGA